MIGHGKGHWGPFIVSLADVKRAFDSVIVSGNVKSSLQDLVTLSPNVSEKTDGRLTIGRLYSSFGFFFPPESHQADGPCFNTGLLGPSF